MKEGIFEGTKNVKVAKENQDPVGEKLGTGSHNTLQGTQILFCVDKEN